MLSKPEVTSDDDPERASCSGDYRALEVATWFASAHRDALLAHTRQGRWSGELIRAACRAGLAGLEIPIEHGGWGLAFSARLAVAEALAKVDFAFAFALVNHHSAALRLATRGSAAARQKYLPPMLRGDLIGCTSMSEEGAGSDFAAISTLARKVDGGWILDGEKRWAANARGGELALVFAQTDFRSGASGIACFIVDLRGQGCVRVEGDDIDGLGAAGIGGFRLQGCRVTDDDLLYPPGDGFRQAMASVNKARVHVAAMACGLLDSALTEATAYAATRRAFGRPLIEQQGLRWSLVDVSMNLELMRMLTSRAASSIERGEEAAIVDAAMAKKFAAAQCLDAVATCIQVFGAAGLTVERGLVARLVAAKAVCLADGTTEMMNERIGATLGRRVGGMSRPTQAPTSPQTAPRRPFKCILLTRPDDGATVATLADLDTDQLPPGDVLVRIDFSTLNYKDALAITGRSPVVRAFPMVPGIDFAGTVIESADPRWSAGDAVLLNGWGVGETHWGGLSERARVRGEWLVALPEGMSARVAMGIGTAGFTAMLCVMTLEERGVTPGAGPVLVTGGNGGVGSIAIALLSGLGYTVTASTGRLGDTPHLMALGASGVLERSRLSAPGKPLQREAWAGAIDCVGSHTLASVLGGMRYGGTVAACGMAQGMDLPGSVAPFILRGVTLAGVDSVHAAPDLRQRAWRRLACDLPEEVVEANTRTIGLGDTIDLAPAMLRGEIRGRVVVDVGR